MTTNSQSRLICTLTCWGVGLLAGVLALALLMILGDWRFIQGAFIGVLVFFIGGALLNWVFCRPLPGETAHATAQSAQTGKAGPSASASVATASASASAAAPASAASAAESSPAPAAEAAPAAAASMETVGASSVIKPSAPLAGQSEIDQAKGSWSYEGEGATAAPAAAAPAASTASSDQTSDYDGDGVLEGSDEGTKPEMLSGPRDGGADNLKEIKGIGPKLEQLVNSMGVYHFDQIAGWSPDEVAWVNANLTGFKGRVTRDNWIDQAKILAEGGSTEFSRRVDKGSVYDE